MTERLLFPTWLRRIGCLICVWRRRRRFDAALRKHREGEKRLASITFPR